MPNPVQIDFVADLSCPFCAMAVTSFSDALAKVGEADAFDLRFQPYELNPNMPREGQDFIDYLSAKSNSTRDQVKGRIELLSKRAADAGFTIVMGDGSRIFNTFDAHRLLHWASLEGVQHQMKQKLYAAYFTEGQDISDHDVLIDIASSVGLNTETARDILCSGEYAEEVRAAESVWKARGVTSVPAIFINGQLVHSGAQTASTFEETLRNL